MATTTTNAPTSVYAPQDNDTNVTINQGLGDAAARALMDVAKAGMAGQTMATGMVQQMATTMMQTSANGASKLDWSEDRRNHSTAGQPAREARINL